MAVFLVIALTLPGKAARAEEALYNPDAPLFYEGDGEPTPDADPAYVPTYALNTQAFNGEITLIDYAADEFGWYYIPAGTEVSFFISTEIGYYQAPSHLFNVNDQELELSNPVITYLDENKNFCYIVPTFDESNYCFSFTMPAAEAHIAATFLPIQDTPVEPVVNTYPLSADAFNGKIIVLYAEQDEYGWYNIPVGTEVSFYLQADDGFCAADSCNFLVDGEERPLPNPVVSFLNENNEFCYFAPTYDDATGWYSFYMPAFQVFINASFIPEEEIPVEPVVNTYPLSADAFNGEITVLYAEQDADGYYNIPEGTEVSFYLTADDGFYAADSCNFLVDGEERPLPNPVVSFLNENNEFCYFAPTYDETTGWYSFIMPSCQAFINASFVEMQPENEYFIGRVAYEGGSIEFVPENLNSTAKEGDVVIFEVTADQGYNLDEVVIFNAYTLEDGSIEADQNSPVEFTKNADGTYSFVMPANPVQIFANFSKPSTPNPGNGNGHGNGNGNGHGNGHGNNGHGNGWGYGNNHGNSHGIGWGCNYGIGYGYGYGYGNSFGYGSYGYGSYGYGNYGYGSLLGGIVGILTSFLFF